MQVWHPDRHQTNDKLRLKAEEKLKRVNSAYDRLRAFLLTGGGLSCRGCGEIAETDGGLCKSCQRERDLDEREERIRQRSAEQRKKDAELRAQKKKRRNQQAREPRTPKFVDIGGRWFNVTRTAWIDFVGTGPTYGYSSGLFETGTAEVSGNTVIVRARNLLFGDVVATLTVDGQRLYGTLLTSMIGLPVEFWKS